MIVRKLVAGSIALAMTGLGFVSAGPADAASHCARHSDYSHVKKGQTEAQVAHWLHSHGHRMSKASSAGYKAEVRSYPTCSSFSSIVISFSATPGTVLRVNAKSAVWVY